MRRLLAARPLGAYCMCIGSASISLDGGRAPLVLSVHHGESVRWHGAKSGNFELEHGRDLAEWLAARGLPDVRDEMDESERRQAQYRAEERTWVAAMPACVVTFREAMLEVGRTGFDTSAELLSQLSEALRTAESDDAQRIRALLSWHASGSGRCSGYPVYEIVPEALLLAEEPGALRATSLAACCRSRRAAAEGASSDDRLPRH